MVHQKTRKIPLYWVIEVLRALEVGVSFIRMHTAHDIAKLQYYNKDCQTSVRMYRYSRVSMNYGINPSDK